MQINRLELEISHKRPGEGLESLAKWCQIANETVTFDLDMMGLQSENFNHIYQEPLRKFKLSKCIGGPTLDSPIWSLVDTPPITANKRDKDCNYINNNYFHGDIVAFFTAVFVQK